MGEIWELVDSLVLPEGADEEVAAIVSQALKARIGVKPDKVVVHEDGGLNTRSEHKSKRIIDERKSKYEAK